MSESGSGSEYQRANVFAFNKATGAASTTFNAQIAGGQVWAITVDAATNSVYVGGSFKTVNGATRGALVKLDASTGARETAFKTPFAAGQVNDLQLITLGGTKRLIVAGSSGRKLMSLNPTTGKDDGYFTSVIADPVPRAWGGVSVHRVAIDPSRTHLVATGNFLTVDGAARSKFFMLNLGGSGASLSSWYYPGFAKPCSTTARDASPTCRGWTGPRTARRSPSPRLDRSRCTNRTSGTTGSGPPTGPTPRSATR